jgi:hypothetical protein
MTSDYTADHLVFGFVVHPTFIRPGRHVTHLQVDDEIENAFARPLKVLEHPAQ